MNKSIDFIKQRIQSGFCQGMENNKYKTMSELSFIEGCKMCGFDSDFSQSFKIKSYNPNEKKRNNSYNYL